jgi:plastocyanin
MKTLSFLVPATLVLGAALAACGGSDSNAQSQPTTTPRASATTRVTPLAPSATAAVETPATAPTEAPAAATPTPATGHAQGGQPTTAPPPPPPAATSTPVPPPAQGQFLTIAAKDTRFNPSQLAAHNGGTLTVTFDNQDAGVAHDLIVYTPAGGIAGQSPVISGPAQSTFSFTPSVAGNYFFKCSLHPQYMTGTIAVAP